MLPPPRWARTVGQEAIERTIAAYAGLASRVEVLDVGERGLPTLLLEHGAADAGLNCPLAQPPELAGDREHQVKVNVCRRRHALPAHRRANGLANVRMPA